MKQASIVILNWNSELYLSKCLNALVFQTFTNFEVLIIDNGSDNGGMNKLLKRYPSLDIHIKKLKSNTGFAVANNIGARIARGKWLALLNADAFPEPDWLEKLLKVAEHHPDAFFSSRQIQANNPDYLDGEGDIYHISGLAWRHNYNHPVYPTDELKEIFSPCAAAALYPRQAFLDVGGFDEDYFSYHEDVDLGFRLRLQGLRSYYVPQAVVHHVGSASTGKKSDFSIYYGHRNLEWTYFKNMPTLFLLLFLPLHISFNIIFLIWFTVTGHGKPIWRAKKDAFLGTWEILQKRKKIQANRQISLTEIYAMLDKDIFSPLKTSLQRHRLEKEL